MANAFATSGAPTAAVKEEPAKKAAPAVVATGEDLSHLSGMIRDKKKLAEELGIGELTLVDISLSAMLSNISLSLLITETAISAMSGPQTARTCKDSRIYGYQP